jgi:hypothetical protein
MGVEGGFGLKIEDAELARRPQIEQLDAIQRNGHGWQESTQVLGACKDETGAGNALKSAFAGLVLN